MRRLENPSANVIQAHLIQRPASFSIKVPESGPGSTCSGTHYKAMDEYACITIHPAPSPLK